VLHLCDFEASSGQVRPFLPSDRIALLEPPFRQVDRPTLQRQNESEIGEVPGDPCEIGKLGGEDLDFAGKVVIAQRCKAAPPGDIGHQVRCLSKVSIGIAPACTMRAMVRSVAIFLQCLKHRRRRILRNHRSQS